MPCPDDETLLAFSQGALDAAARADIAGHLDACPTCRSAVAAAAEMTDTLADDPMSAPASSAKASPRQIWRFELMELAGAGAMGRVYRGRDRGTGGTVAVKIVRPRDPRDAARFTQEAGTLMGLRHPAIVRYLAHGVDGLEMAFLVTEWLEGPTLAVALHRGTMTLDDALTVTRRLAAGLVEAHRAGVVHRDVKPGNVVLVGGRVDECKLLDFGLARLSWRETVLTSTGAVLGTPGYMAPEQARGARDVGPAADVYALGGVLFHCLTGHVPFSEKDAVLLLSRIVHETPPAIAELRPDAPRALAELVARMLAKSPADRPSSVEVHRATSVLLDELRTRSGGAAAPDGDRGLGWAERRASSILVTRAPEAAVLGEIVDRHAGRIEQLAAGGALAVFDAGASEPGSDVAARAARAALAIRDRSGSAVAVVLGATSASRPVSSGPAADAAASLLDGAQPGSIRIDRATVGLLDARFVVVADEGDAACVLIRETDLGEPRPVLGVMTACVGQSSQLQYLETLLADTRQDGVPRAALVVAEPGMGKSRLLYELKLRLAATTEPADVWIGRGDRLRIEDLQAWLDAVGSPSKRARAILLEDVFAAQPGALRLIDGALERTGTPLLVVATARADVERRCPDPWPDRQVTVLHFGDLGVRATEELARQVLGEDSRQARLEELVDLSDGNPLLLEELIRTAGDRAGPGLPLSVLAMLQGRFDAFGELERRVLRAGSLFGHAFRPEWVAAVLPLSVDASSLERALAALVQGVVLVEDRGAAGTEFRFRSPRLRNIAYAMWDEQDLTTAQRLAAEVRVP